MEAVSALAPADRTKGLRKTLETFSTGKASYKPQAVNAIVEKFKDDFDPKSAEFRSELSTQITVALDQPNWGRVR